MMIEASTVARDPCTVFAKNGVHHDHFTVNTRWRAALYDERHFAQHCGGPALVIDSC